MCAEKQGGVGRGGGVQGGLGLPLSGNGSDGGEDECNGETGHVNGSQYGDDGAGDGDGCVLRSMEGGERDAESAGGPRAVVECHGQ